MSELATPSRGGSPARRLPRVLTTQDVARMRGTSREAATRWLKRNAGKHFRRTPAGWVISARAYARLQETDALARMRSQLADLTDRVSNLESTAAAHASALSRGRLL